MFRSVVLFLACIASVTLAIYEDQIGLYDWHAQYIGATRYQLTDSQIAVFYTHSHILAAVDSKSGRVLWRHKFSPNDDVTLEPVIAGEEVVTYHISGHYRHWNIATGLLTLDAPLHSEPLLYYHALPHGSLLRVTRNAVYGGKTDTIEIPKTMSYVGYLRSGQESEGFVYVPGQEGLIVKHSARDDSVAVTKIELPWATSDVKFVSSDDSMAALKGDILYYKVVGADSFRNVILSEIGVTWKVNAIRAAGKSVYIASGDKMSAVLLIRDGFMKAIKALDKDIVGQVVGADNIVLISRPENTVSLVQLSNGFEHHSYTLNGEGDRGGIVSINTLPSSHPCSTVTTVKIPGLLISWEDESVTVVGATEKCGWEREESLANVRSATMLDLPASSVIPLNLNKPSNPIKMWTDRILCQLNDLQKFINQHFGAGYRDTSMEMERDSFNLNKLILVATKVGKVAVLHSISGRVLWSRYMDGIATLENGKYEIRLVRSASHYPLPPLVAIVAASKDNENTVLNVINPLDGSTQYNRVIKSKVAQVQLTTVEDSEAARILLLVTRDNKVHTYPPNSHSLIKDLPLYFALVYPDTMQLKGFSLTVTGESVMETWSTKFRGDKILSVATKATNDAVYSQGRVLGDRSVLHKYINPNLIAVAMETGTGDKGHVDILLYDMVSGIQIHTVRHKQYSGPVHLLLAENWMVYHLWSAKLRRYEIVVAEFYISHSSNSTSFSSLLPNLSPYAIQQSYISTTPLSALAVTSTLKSITNRAVLFAESGGRIASIPKQLLDPRRPTVPTAADKYEQLIPYSPLLVTPPVSYLTYNKTLFGIRDMITGSSGIESTSLLFVYGDDLYFTRVTPSKTFDMLNEDFDYYLIGIVLIGLCLGTIATQALADNKALNKKWK